MNTQPTDMAAVWRKLGRMLSSGVPLLQSLSVVGKESDSTAMQTVLAGISAAINRGQTLWEALEAHPALFPQSLRLIVRAGEQTGTLERACLDVAAGLEDGTLSAAAPAAGEAPAEVAEAEPAPVVRHVETIFVEAIRQRASDIQLDWVSGQFRVRLRVDGVLRVAGPAALTVEDGRAIVSRIKIMAGMNMQERRRPQDGRIQLSLEGRAFDLRVHVASAVNGEHATLRLLTRDMKRPTIEKQGFTPAQADRVRRWSELPSGLVLCTGPTGSGKTTTLYSLIEHVNRPEVKIISVEDPVEYEIAGITQLQVNAAAGCTIPALLRSTLRQDPDVILVGEIRDLETAQVCVQASLTGHLVFSTLHTNSAVDAVMRLVDVGLPPYLVSATVAGVCSQVLLRKVCPDCRTPFEPEAWMKSVVPDPAGFTFVRGAGCERCKGTGYRGRTAAHELLEPDAAFRAELVRGADLRSLQAAARRCGWRPLREDALAKAAEGLVTIEDVLRVTPEP